jgi:hypothetical protein
LARPETGGGIFGRTARFRAVETALSRASSAKPRKVKDYSGGARKPDLRRTAWWCWQDSKGIAGDDEDATNWNLVAEAVLIGPVSVRIFPGPTGKRTGNFVKNDPRD